MIWRKAMDKEKKYSPLIITILLLAVIILLIGVIWRLFPRKIDTYEYPFTADSPVWSSMSPQYRVERLKIPDDILKRMTDKALIQAIADYPLLIDLYLMGTVEDGLKVLPDECSALKELLSRNTAKTSFLTDGIEIMHELKEADENSISISALYDIISTLYKDIDMEQYYIK